MVTFTEKYLIWEPRNKTVWQSSSDVALKRIFTTAPVWQRARLNRNSSFKISKQNPWWTCMQIRFHHGYATKAHYRVLCQLSTPTNCKKLPQRREQSGEQIGLLIQKVIFNIFDTIFEVIFIRKKDNLKCSGLIKVIMPPSEPKTYHWKLHFCTYWHLWGFDWQI